jgi:hypothetical protein
LVGNGSPYLRGVESIVTLRFKVERESEPGSFEQVKQPCEGAWPGAYLDEFGQAQVDWFITLDDVPSEVEGHPVRLLEASEEGVSGHIIIQDQS